MPSPAAARVRRRSLLALLIVLPLALFAQGGENGLEWWHSRELFARQVEAGASGSLAGADWKLVSLRRVADRPGGMAVALLEVEAAVRDPAVFARLPCSLALEADGRRWLPQFLTPTEVSRLPERRGKAVRTCGQALASKPAAGTVLRMSESYLLPAAVFDKVGPVLSLPGGRPHYLRLEPAR